MRGSQLVLTYKDSNGRVRVIERQDGPMHHAHVLVRRMIEHYVDGPVTDGLVYRVCSDRKVNVRTNMRVNVSTLKRVIDEPEPQHL